MASAVGLFEVSRQIVWELTLAAWLEPGAVVLVVSQAIPSTELLSAAAEEVEHLGELM